MSKSFTYTSGAIRLSKDFAKLVNNPVGSDIRFFVGGGEITLSSDSANEKQSDTPTATFYGHSLILRFRSKYFATLYDNEWKEKSDGIFKKPNVSPVAFHALLHYVYTGSVEVVDSSLLPQLIAAAEEMELDELSIACQSRLIKELKDSCKTIDRTEDNEATDEQNNFNLAVCSLLIPSLVLAYDHTLEIFYEELLSFIVCHMKIIVKSKKTFSTFKGIPDVILRQILSMDSLELDEYDIWQLALSWACQRTKLLKPIVEAQVRLNANEDMEAESIPSNDNLELEEKSEQPLIPDDQLRDLKSQLRPLLPTIRFTLIKPEQYLQTLSIFNFFLPSRRSLELQRFFFKPGTSSQEAPRVILKNPGSIGIPESVIVNLELGILLRQWIHEERAIDGCSSPSNLKFKLLYRASIHGFSASAFHNNCDNKGPTVVLVRSSNGFLFGGVNFTDWISSRRYSYSGANFLFSLKDRDNRTQSQSLKFSCTNGYYATKQDANFGPIFGEDDLCILDNSNTGQSFSNLPQDYGGRGASNTALAGAQSFKIADYEVFSMSKE